MDKKKFEVMRKYFFLLGFLFAVIASGQENKIMVRNLITVGDDYFKNAQ